MGIHRLHSQVRLPGGGHVKDELYGHLAIWALPHLLDFHGIISNFLKLTKPHFFFSVFALYIATQAK